MENTLCEELIEKILLRLPVKSLIRFKCVCKSWFSLISDPHFANSHFELSARPSHRFLLYISASCSEPRFMVDIEDVSPLVARIVRSPLPNESVGVLGSCRGFVLLGRYPNLCLWNPATGFYRNLLYPEIDLNLNLFGLGYDPSTNDYLAVVSCQSGLVLFSFRNNSWKEIHEDLVPYDAYHPNQCGLFFNGAIHWPAYCYLQLDKMTVVLDEVILVFDLIKRNLSEISMPIDDFTNGFFRDLRIMGGCLGVRFVRNGTTHMWVMKGYKVHSSWTEIPPTKHLYDISYLAMYTVSLLSLPIDCGGSMETTCQQKQTRIIRVEVEVPISIMQSFNEESRQGKSDNRLKKDVVVNVVAIVLHGIPLERDRIIRGNRISHGRVSDLRVRQKRG